MRSSPCWAKGDMGEVYRARDSRLGRDVAIKTSRGQFNERFEREARAVAARNHPNICHLYDVGPDYIVMELVEGENLRGPLPADEALKIARQIAGGIEKIAANRLRVTACRIGQFVDAASCAREATQETAPLGRPTARLRD